jgi:hypothetical protein
MSSISCLATDAIGDALRRRGGNASISMTARFPDGRARERCDMKISGLLIVSAATALIAGCADYYGPGYGYGYGPGYYGPGYYGPNAYDSDYYGPGYYGPVADTYYDGYYDGYYGPIYDGYWGNGGLFNHIHGTVRATPRHEQRPG